MSKAKQASHTPTPWKVVVPGHGMMPNARKYRCVQIGADDSYTTLEMLPEDARFIVRAVNAHDELVESVTDLLQVLCEVRGLPDLEEIDEPCSDLCRNSFCQEFGCIRNKVAYARAALAKAGAP